MVIYINGIKTNLDQELSLSKLLKLNFTQSRSSYAVALNNEFIPKSRYKDIIIKEGDKVEVVTAKPGG